MISFFSKVGFCSFKTLYSVTFWLHPFLFESSLQQRKRPFHILASPFCPLAEILLRTVKATIVTIIVFALGPLRLIFSLQGKCFLFVVALRRKREKILTNKITSSAYIMCVKCTLLLLETKSDSIKSLGDKNKYCVTTCLCTMCDSTLSLCLSAAGCYSGVRKKAQTLGGCYITI